MSILSDIEARDAEFSDDLLARNPHHLLTTAQDRRYLLGLVRELEKHLRAALPWMDCPPNCDACKGLEDVLARLEE